jgi:4-hydroxy-tetrahydrodipicolinate reductase
VQIVILGDGSLGRAVEATASAEGHGVRVFGRPRASERHLPGLLRGADAVVDASVGQAVLSNLRVALDSGCRRFVIATTGWRAEEDVVDMLLRERGAAAVVASNFSLGVTLFGRLIDVAVGLFGAVPEFDPFLVEWHRRSKSDRPSGTADDLARRITERHPGKRRLATDPSADRTADQLEVVSIRAGASPGMHLVAFDAPGETVELRLTARDRSAYATGVLAAAHWLVSEPRDPGITRFDRVVDELLEAPRASGELV